MQWKDTTKKCSSYHFKELICWYNQADDGQVKMSFVGRCYSLEEAGGNSGDDDKRNVHHIMLMLQSGRVGRRCHLLGNVIPLKKKQETVETTTTEMFIISF
ncbi:hypothetical protein CDAR_373051 [Caerostris darwini]|uniref:Uncharacterized protein n=1 Tax=Caerostris darwini TaxID=1538125 RepID=A0AAV4SQI0_9ARAC|nr:hypothetical protein CDAR_373051 [Caerostris darwini]